MIAVIFEVVPSADGRQAYLRTCLRSPRGREIVNTFLSPHPHCATS